jgi:hypothetical protein
MKTAPIRKQFSATPARTRAPERPRNLRSVRRAARDRNRRRVADLEPHVKTSAIPEADPVAEISCTIDPDFDEAGQEFELARFCAMHRELTIEDDAD